MINTDNYECYFFQYQEGLLDEATRHEVEAFAATHPDLAEELALYAESPVLTAQDLEMPDKKSLKHETSFAWWRYAAAAVVLGAVAVTLFFVLQRPNTENTPLVAESHIADTMISTPSSTDSITTQIATPQTKTSQPLSSSVMVATIPEETVETIVLPDVEETQTASVNITQDSKALLAEAQPGPDQESVPEEPTETSTFQMLYVDNLITYVDQPQQPAKHSLAGQAHSLWAIANALYPERVAPINDIKSTIEETPEHVKPLVKKIEPIYQFIAKIF